MHSDRQIAALGRPLHPGMLYNACNDTYIPGVTLWSDEDMTKVMKIRGHQNTSFDVTASDSMKKKTKLLDISASLKGSFLAGLISIEGSASFLNDRISSSRQCRVTMRYKETTLFKELVATDMEVKHPEIFGRNEATHVVTAVLYGAEAFMVFDQMAADYLEKNEVKGTLKAMIDKIPLLKLSGEGSVAMSEEDRLKARRFSCKFHGDFKLKENPSSFEEAVVVYKRLPSLLGQKGEEAVPLKVWLYPLVNLESKASKLVRDINSSAVAILESVIEHLHDAKMRAHDLIKLSKGMNLTVLRDKLETFQSKRTEYTVFLKRRLKGVLPEIRGGTVPETALNDILRFHEESTFCKVKMRDWLDEKETEITIVQSYLGLLGSTSLVPPGPELDRVLYDPKLNTVVVFSFTSLQHPEPYLANMEECLNCEDFTKMADVKVAIDKAAKVVSGQNTVPWYKYPGAIPALRSCSPLFLVVKAKCMRNPLHSALISYAQDDSHPGSSIRVYKNGVCINPHLKPPGKNPEAGGQPGGGKGATAVTSKRGAEKMKTEEEEEDDPLGPADHQKTSKSTATDGSPWNNDDDDGSITTPEDPFTAIDGSWF
ncbi:stonustoxin subunit alpha-like [Engraulis encrasicolus]|uniref:stonustoxin subunit alpha-like n=1 Tax=Engraulis encrasicolus TaxID=184585 RepID=UPI002FD31F84